MAEKRNTWPSKSLRSGLVGETGRSLRLFIARLVIGGLAVRGLAVGGFTVGGGFGIGRLGAGGFRVAGLGAGGLWIGKFCIGCRLGGRRSGQSFGASGGRRLSWHRQFAVLLMEAFGGEGA